MRSSVFRVIGFITLAVLIACGSSSSSSNDTAKQRFVGTWRYVAGTITTTCEDGARTDPISGATRVIALGTDSDLVITWGDCSFKLNLNNDQALPVAGQNCTATGITLNAWALTTTDGQTMTDSGSSTSIEVATCSMVTWSGTLTKL